MTLKFYFTAAALLAFSGCANQTVEKQHYFLPTPEVSTQSSEFVIKAPLVELGEIQLADFLDNDGLVLQLDDITLNQAKRHLWAEALQQQLHRGLRERVNQQQQQLLIVGPHAAADFSLSIEIHDFHGRHDGLALTSGQWQLKNKQGELVAVNRFTLTSELSEPGYPALVRALGQNLDKLALQIAEKLIAHAGR
jgi:hypothetical protein